MSKFKLQNNMICGVQQRCFLDFEICKQCATKLIYITYFKNYFSFFQLQEEFTVLSVPLLMLFVVVTTQKSGGVSKKYCAKKVMQNHNSIVFKVKNKCMMKNHNIMRPKPPPPACIKNAMVRGGEYF